MQNPDESVARQGPIALLVLGMHRSGTSAVTGMLDRLGIPAAGELLPAESYNEKGIYENKAVNLFHNRLLAHLGSKWDDPLPLSNGFVGTEAGQTHIMELAGIIERDLLANTQIFAVKDPRMCRFIPLWKAALDRLGTQPRAIIPLRHPIAVAGSLQARDRFPRAKSFLLWLVHTLAAERETRGMVRSFVGYDEMLGNWRGTADKLADDLGLKWPKERARVENEIDEFLSGDLRHHQSHAAIGEGTRLDALVEHSWNALGQLVTNPSDGTAQAALDEIQNELDMASRVIGPYVAWEFGAYSDACEKIAYLEELERVLRTQNSEYFQAIADAHEAATSERQRQKAAHQRELIHETGLLRKEASKLESEIVQLRHVADRVGWLESEAERLNAELQHESAIRQAIQNSTSWRLTSPIRRIAGLLPASAKGTLRRGAKASWWAMTPWRTPQRLQFLRERERLSMLGGVEPQSQYQATPLLSPASPNRRGAGGQLPLGLFTVPNGAPRVSMVTDSINAGSLFGGVATALIFSALLAQETGRKLRIVTRTQKADPGNVSTVFRAHGIEWKGNIEFAFADTSDDENEIDANPNELFVTTSWWTTEATRASVDPANIIYLLQEDERMFYPLGDKNLASSEVMSDSFVKKVINSGLLHKHLAQDGIISDETPFFEPAFPGMIYFPEAGTEREKRNFFFYARPNNARNLYDRGVSVINEAISEGILDPSVWDINFVGKDLHPLTLANGVKPNLLQNMTWEEYAAYVRSVDLALTLMYTPHPSYPPLDVAACGGIAVTNRFGVKQDLRQYSRSIICAESDVASLVDGLRLGVDQALDSQGRGEKFSENHINRDWRMAFDTAFASILGNDFVVR